MDNKKKKFTDDANARIGVFAMVIMIVLSATTLYFSGSSASIHAIADTPQDSISELQ